ncbi:MAG: hypothetical protein NZZ41_00295 [Candidatus Dojkabacteria bacterium]|nr:hypothetical protein [Candidatus Dojkabacteria bacterium]
MENSKNETEITIYVSLDEDKKTIKEISGIKQNEKFRKLLLDKNDEDYETIRDKILKGEMNFIQKLEIKLLKNGVKIIKNKEKPKETNNFSLNDIIIF